MINNKQYSQTLPLPTEFYTTDEVLEVLKISYDDLKKLVKQQKLERYKSCRDKRYTFYLKSQVNSVKEMTEEKSL